MSGALLENLVGATWELAGDIGRLRRRLEPESSAGFTAARIAHQVACIDTMLRPSAAEIVGQSAPGDPDAIDEALRIVDEHDRRMRARLGEKAA
jgi:hypothetical protein